VAKYDILAMHKVVQKPCVMMMVSLPLTKRECSHQQSTAFVHCPDKDYAQVDEDQTTLTKQCIVSV
jgi:hypothetical protein